MAARRPLSVPAARRPLSVPEVAAALQASEAYVRRLLIGQRLYGFKVGPVWAVYEEDLETFRRLRRPPGRPARAKQAPAGEARARLRIDKERVSAGTGGALRKTGRKQPRRPAARG